MTKILGLAGGSEAGAGRPRRSPASSPVLLARAPRPNSANSARPRCPIIEGEDA